MTSETAPDGDTILEKLPPEQLLETEQWQLIQAGTACMHELDTVQQYVAYENQHAQRTWIFHLLSHRGRELREQRDTHS